MPIEGMNPVGLSHLCCLFTTRGGKGLFIKPRIFWLEKDRQISVEPPQIFFREEIQNVLRKFREHKIPLDIFLVPGDGPTIYRLSESTIKGVRDFVEKECGRLPRDGLLIAMPFEMLSELSENTEKAASILTHELLHPYVDAIFPRNEEVSIFKKEIAKENPILEHLIVAFEDYQCIRVHIRELGPESAKRFVLHSFDDVLKMYFEGEAIAFPIFAAYFGIAAFNKMNYPAIGSEIRGKIIDLLAGIHPSLKQQIKEIVNIYDGLQYLQELLAGEELPNREQFLKLYRIVTDKNE